jgi:UDP-N-acetylmuramoylalanine--D-glutamate ligase
MQHLDGKRAMVVGLARSGHAAAELLHRRGAVVTVSDSRPPWSFEHEIPALLAAKIGLEFGQNGVETALGQELIVVSPGVPWDLPALTVARERGIPVVAEVEAASWFLHGDLVGVTGSNGKTTTTSLIGKMLESSGIHTLVGGNIGVPLASMVNEARDESAVVVELSSFQLEGTESLHPRVAVILNITPNHLDRHPSLEAYVEAKARILRNQTDDDYAILNADDPTVLALADRVRGQKIFFSRTQDLPEGLLISEGKVVYRVAHLERDLFSPRDVRLRGAFNLENVLAASAAACVLGADFDVLGKAVREFRGVEHRLEPVGEVLGVEFYNDSKATSVDATVKALGAFERGVHLILGGKDKGAPYAPLIPLLKGRVREVLVIGAAAGRIASELAGTVELVQAGNLESATREAFQHARSGDIVLLSPACSSYDQFQDFEHRGRMFKTLVEALAREGEAVRSSRSRAALQNLAPKPQPRAKFTPATSPPLAAKVTSEPPASHAIPPQTDSVDPSKPEARAAASIPPGAVDSNRPAVESDVAVEDRLPQAVPASAVAPPADQTPAEQTPEINEPEPRFVASDNVPGSETVAKPVAPAPLRLEPADTGQAELAPQPVQERESEPAAKRESVHLTEPVQTERIYVYETDAEERPPLDLPEIPLDDLDLRRDVEPQTGNRLDSIDLKKRAGEPLIFEVTSQAPKSPGAGSSESGAGRSRRKSRSKVAEGPAEADTDNQDRFPGV